jgi:hypothetical protein
MLLEECLLGKFLCILNAVADIDVVKQDVTLHGPDLKTNSSHRLEVRRGLVFEVIWVLYLFGFPDAFVRGIINVRSGPFALVQGILDSGLLPFSTTESISN